MPQKLIREIKDVGKTLAIIYSKKLKTDNVKFLTPLSYPLQIGLLEHSRGKIVPAHYHPPYKYNVRNTQEFLYVERGRMDVEIYTTHWKKKATVTLTKGDFLLFVDCGHKVIFHKGARVIEVKQGPYPGDKKAKVFK